MRNLPTYFLCLLVAVAPGCATNGPISGAAVGGVAAITAVFDQMLADGLIKPEQYITLNKGIDSLNSSIDAVKVATAAANQIATEAKNGGVSPETMAGGLSGTALAVLAAVRAWRGKPTKGAKAAPQA